MTDEEAKQLTKWTSKRCGLIPIYLALETEKMKVVVISPFNENFK